VGYAHAPVQICACPCVGCNTTPRRYAHTGVEHNTTMCGYAHTPVLNTTHPCADMRIPPR